MFDLLEKVAVFKNDCLTWIKEENLPCIYALRIGNEAYIGSTWNLKNRINNYISLLPKGEYKGENIQKAYKENKSFVVYIMERVVIGNLRLREQFYINLLKPTLNSIEYANSHHSDFSEDKIQNGFFQLRTSECLKEHNLTPKFVANKLNITTFELNKAMQFPTHDFLYKLARTLDIPFIDFFTNESYYLNGKTECFMNLDGKNRKITLSKP